VKEFLESVTAGTKPDLRLIDNRGPSHGLIPSAASSASRTSSSPTSRPRSVSPARRRADDRRALLESTGALATAPFIEPVLRYEQYKVLWRS